MTRFLRTASPRRLLSALLTALVAIAGGTAIAVAATSGGPVAASRPLAQAIHDSLQGPKTTAVSADITFTNRLVSSSAIEGSDPLLTGASGRLWWAPGRLRIELQSSGGGGDGEIVVDHGSFWVYDPALATVYEGTLPADRSSDNTERSGSWHAPTVSAIARFLGKLSKHLSLQGASGTDVGGQPAYQVRVSPRLGGGKLAGLLLAWDALRGIPLSIGLYAKGDPTPVLALTAANVKYDNVSAGDFSAAPPAGAKVVQLDTASKLRRQAARAERVRRPATSPADLPFTLDAPATLAGRSRSSVHVIGHGRHASAVVVYGHDLNGLVVYESATPAKAPAGTAAAAAGGGDGGPGLSLPTVTLSGGVVAHELDTELGSLLRFDRGGVSYVLLGSVDPSVIDAAARAL